jgi:DJ-1/PfpI family
MSRAKFATSPSSEHGGRLGDDVYGKSLSARTTGREWTMDLSGKRIAILATNGFEQSELEVPRDRLIKAGATVDVVSLASGEIKGWDKKDRGRPVKVDKALDEVAAADYDAAFYPAARSIRTCYVSSRRL